MSYKIKLTGNVNSYSNGFYTATQEKPYVELEDAAAAEAAVATGYFTIVERPGSPAPLEEKVGQEAPATAKGHLDAEQLGAMRFDELKRLAEDMGIDVTGIRKKTDLVAAIVAEEVEYPEDGEGEEVPDGIFG